MSSIKIQNKKLKGTIDVPPSKSMAHRALICASLAKGISNIDNIDYSNDIDATLNALTSLGSIIEGKGSLKIDGTNMNTLNNMTIDCKESGSTLRFLIPISLIKKNKVRFIGEGNLGKRPLDTYYDIFNDQGINYSYTKEGLDLTIEGQLKPDNFNIPGNVSSQFISGLLFALPLLDGDSKITIIGVLESKGYVDLTLQMLKMFNIQINNNDYKEFIIKGNQNYKPINYRVEGDYSQAAFFLVANQIGNEVKLNSLNSNSLQGDKVILDLLKEIKDSDERSELIVDASQCPDIIPVLCVALATKKGRSRVINARRLRIKECDRLQAIYDNFKSLGIDVEMNKDDLLFKGSNNFKGGKAKTYDDHRIAMTLAIISTIALNEITIDNKECVNKSYPSFWEDFMLLGGKYNECNMEE